MRVRFGKETDAELKELASKPNPNQLDTETVSYSFKSYTMMRFQMNAPNFDGNFGSSSELKCRKLAGGSVCEHLAGIRIHDVKRISSFDEASSSTLKGSENGSAANMVLHSTGQLAQKLFGEGCSGESHYLAL